VSCFLYSRECPTQLWLVLTRVSNTSQVYLRECPTQLKCGMLDDLLDVIDLEEKRSGDEVPTHPKSRPHENVWYKLVE